jgi:hypothetical protein
MMPDVAVQDRRRLRNNQPPMAGRAAVKSEQPDKEQTKDDQHHPDHTKDTDDAERSK